MQKLWNTVEVVLLKSVDGMTQNLSDRVQQNLKEAGFLLWGQNDRLVNTGNSFML